MNDNSAAQIFSKTLFAISLFQDKEYQNVEQRSNRHPISPNTSIIIETKFIPSEY